MQSHLRATKYVAYKFTIVDVLIKKGVDAKNMFGTHHVISVASRLCRVEIMTDGG